MKNILNIVKDSNHSFSLFDRKLVDELEWAKSEKLSFWK